MDFLMGDACGGQWRTRNKHGGKGGQKEVYNCRGGVLNKNKDTGETSMAPDVKRTDNELAAQDGE